MESFVRVFKVNERPQHSLYQKIIRRCTRSKFFGGNSETAIQRIVAGAAEFGGEVACLFEPEHDRSFIKSARSTCRIAQKEGVITKCLQIISIVVDSMTCKIHVSVVNMEPTHVRNFCTTNFAVFRIECKQSLNFTGRLVYVLKLYRY